jgi:5'-deoxynucleotidase YfbR-like HD superfamily hydrolase
MSLMTLDEAIQHCRDKENCSQCGQEHKQLREWLEELKELRTRYNLHKPHGRLIDADKLRACLNALEYIAHVGGGRPTFEEALEEIAKAPTIIEAEE